MAIKEYYKDKIGNLYYIIQADKGKVQQGNDIGLIRTAPILPDNGKEMSTSKAVFYTFTVNYDNAVSKELTRYSLNLGVGQNTGTKYTGSNTVNLIVNDVTTSDRFLIHSNNVNNNTGVMQGGTPRQIFTYKLASAT